MLCLLPYICTGFAGHRKAQGTALALQLPLLSSLEGLINLARAGSLPIASRAWRERVITAQFEYYFSSFSACFFHLPQNLTIKVRRLSV